jgi:hypothetical protein
MSISLCSGVEDFACSFGVQQPAPAVLVNVLCGSHTRHVSLFTHLHHSAEGLKQHPRLLGLCMATGTQRSQGGQDLMSGAHALTLRLTNCGIHRCHSINDMER